MTRTREEERPEVWERLPRWMRLLDEIKKKAATVDPRENPPESARLK